MAQKIKIPESVLKALVQPLDGRRYTEVELVVDNDGVALFIERTGGHMEWSRAKYNDWQAARRIRRGKL